MKAKLDKQSEKRHRHAVDPERRKRSRPLRQNYNDLPVPGGNQGGRQANWSAAENDRFHSCDRSTLTGLMLRVMNWREPRISDRIERDEQSRRRHCVEGALNAVAAAGLLVTFDPIADPRFAPIHHP